MCIMSAMAAVVWKSSALLKEAASCPDLGQLHEQGPCLDLWRRELTYYVVLACADEVAHISRCYQCHSISHTCHIPSVKTLSSGISKAQYLILAQIFIKPSESFDCHDACCVCKPARELWAIRPRVTRYILTFLSRHSHMHIFSCNDEQYFRVLSVLSKPIIHTLNSDYIRPELWKSIAPWKRSLSTCRVSNIAFDVTDQEAWWLT